MSASSGFGPHSAYSVFEAMRPEPGFSIERMVCFTYSVDLVAVTAMILSMSGAGEEELSAGPMSLVDALETLGPRLAILHQKGRLQPARRHFGILHLFDGVLHAISPERGASWHPKAALARYQGDDQSLCWRFWLGSRNLTISTDREAGLVLHGHLAKKGQRIPDIAAAVRELGRDLAWPEPVLAELADLRWRLPDGVKKFRKLHWRRLGAEKAFFSSLTKAKRILVVSPFADKTGMRALAPRAAAGPALELLTIQHTADKLGTQAGATIRVAPAPQPDEPAIVPGKEEGPESERPEPIDFKGLHAKLILQRSETRNRLWIGSANATGRGLAGPNAELVAELDVDAATATALEAFAQSHVEAIIAEPSAEKLAEEAADRALDDALHDIFDVPFSLNADDEGLHLEAPCDLDRFLQHYRLECWLFTLPDSPADWPAGARRVLIHRGPVPLRLHTFLIGFRATALGKPPAARAWAQTVDFPALVAAARDRAATAAYIGASQLASWFRARLRGIIPDERVTWAGAPKSGGDWRPADSPFGLGAFALEEVLAAWARNPPQFEERAGAISRVLDGFRADFEDQTDEDAAAARDQLGEIESFWSAVRDCLDMSPPDGA